MLPVAVGKVELDLMAARRERAGVDLEARVVGFTD